jgi:hypothetical protein
MHGEERGTAGEVISVLVSCNADSLESESRDAVEVSLEGFADDRHAGFVRAADGRVPEYPRGTPIRNDRQVSLVSTEEMMVVAEAMGIPRIEASWLGANLEIAGIEALSQLPPNTRLAFSSGAVLVVQALNRPCAGPGRVIAKQYRDDQLISAFTRGAANRRGLVACVERAGWISRGDRVEVRIPGDR